jgi:competence protein ComEC
VLTHLDVGRLVVPAPVTADPGMAALLRCARERGVPVTPVARGSAVTLNGPRLEVLWPPARDAPRERNDASLVARLLLRYGIVLLTSDIGAAVERRLVRSDFLRCDVLILPHHGSRGSNTQAFLVATRPQVALIPAGPAVTGRHPHPQVLAQLRRLVLPFRVPAHEGWCGAEPDPSGRWRPWP